MYEYWPVQTIPPPSNFSIPTPSNFSNPHPPKISQYTPPPKKKISQPLRKSFTPPPPQPYVTLSCILSTTCVNHQHQPHWQFLVFSILIYFSRFETILLFCTLFLESHPINTTSPHFQLPFIDIYNSLLLLSLILLEYCT